MDSETEINILLADTNNYHCLYTLCITNDSRSYCVSNCSLLQRALIICDTKTVDAAIKLVDLRYKNSQGHTALDIAIGCGKTEIVHRLMEQMLKDDIYISVDTIKLLKANNIIIPDALKHKLMELSSDDALDGKKVEELNGVETPMSLIKTYQPTLAPEIVSAPITVNDSPIEPQLVQSVKTYALGTGCSDEVPVKMDALGTGCSDEVKQGIVSNPNTTAEPEEMKQLNNIPDNIKPSIIECRENIHTMTYWANQCGIPGDESLFLKIVNELNKHLGHHMYAAQHFEDLFHYEAGVRSNLVQGLARVNQENTTLRAELLECKKEKQGLEERIKGMVPKDDIPKLIEASMDKFLSGLK